MRISLCWGHRCFPCPQILHSTVCLHSVYRCNIRPVRKTGCRWKTTSILNPEGLLHDAVQHIPSIVTNIGNRIGFRNDKNLSLFLGLFNDDVLAVFFV